MSLHIPPALHPFARKLPSLGLCRTKSCAERTVANVVVLRTIMMVVSPTDNAMPFVEHNETNLRADQHRHSKTIMIKGLLTYTIKQNRCWRFRAGDQRMKLPSPRYYSRTWCLSLHAIILLRFSTKKRQNWKNLPSAQIAGEFVRLIQYAVGGASERLAWATLPTTY